MPAPLIRYALDPTGVNPDNAVSGEIKTLSMGNQVRAAAPTYGPFFAESMVIYDHAVNRLLVKDVDYALLDLVEEPSRLYAKEIMQTILVINTNVSNQIRLSYQVLGGLYQNNSEGLIEMYDTIMNDGRPVDWTNVINTPSEYPPQPHLHEVQDIAGWGPVVVALERIRAAIVLSNIPAFESLIDWVKAYASPSVIFDPTVVQMNAGQSQTFNITTSNRDNGTELFWTIQHHGTSDLNFEQVSGSFVLFQNRSSFTINLSDLPPNTNRTFDVLIRADSVTGGVLTKIEGIIYIGNTFSPANMFDLLTACCLYEDGMPPTVESMYVIGKG